MLFLSHCTSLTVVCQYNFIPWPNVPVTLEPGHESAGPTSARTSLLGVVIGPFSMNNGARLAIPCHILYRFLRLLMKTAYVIRLILCLSTLIPVHHRSFVFVQRRALVTPQTLARANANVFCFQGRPPLVLVDYFLLPMPPS